MSTHPAVALPLTVRNEAKDKSKGNEGSAVRASVVVACILFAFLLAFVQGYRAGRMAGQRSKSRVSDVLVFVQGFFCTVLLVATALVVVTGSGLHGYDECQTALIICVIGFGGTKIALYLFLLERIRIVRAPFINRWCDPLYVIGGVLIVSCFIAITGSQFANRIVVFQGGRRECSIGFRPPTAYLVVVLDVTTNLALTGIFIRQLRPAVALQIPRIPSMANSAEGTNTSNAEGIGLWIRSVRRTVWGSCLTNLQVMLVRNVIGALIMLISSITFNILMASQEFARRGHACMLLCLTDVVICMLVTQYLTMRSVEQEATSHRPSRPTLDRWSSPASPSNSAISSVPSLDPINIHAKGHVSTVGQLPSLASATAKNTHLNVP
ncbi:hypothetical protein COCMIDRAFT_30803 [Bipolaris oryzae ATCC 44560]|uniref:G-protein coupled receptors family 3 profile domain-containing protein n=1 Tax=Bipolaris oryzae ATCC 44560 TaxID=930090 RepID=W6YRW8_COCMI|nr:uncharacterized protein COCMIDRAFT_30803 [Bipolaris oryzae ATCC 44560]EUC40233.1 hypothetical protein COCMIDRAFT_30803 [Bipolaris oryzae ATCC 44560]